MKFETLAREILGRGKTVEITEDCASWRKRGGYADSYLTRIHKMLDKHDFKMRRSNDIGTPDDSVMGNDRSYTNYDGTIKIEITEFYGVTADRNRFVVKMSNAVVASN